MNNRRWHTFSILMVVTLLVAELVMITTPETPGRCAAPPEARFYAPPPGASWDI